MNKKELEYKGYKGSINYSEQDGVFYGKILDIADLYSYEGESIEELEIWFKEVVNEYIIDKE